MNDPCSIKICCHTKALPVFEHVFGATNYIEEYEGIVEALFHEINYGGLDELQTLAGNGIPFTGTKEAGEDSTPSCFCSAEGRLFEIEADMKGEPVIQTSNGKIKEFSLRNFNDYMEHEKKAKAALLQPYPLD